ncbi:MAG: hypothetical protein RIS92_830 [Verrucomicrobiota bacterium]
MLFCDGARTDSSLAPSDGAAHCRESVSKATRALNSARWFRRVCRISLFGISLPECIPLFPTIPLAPLHRATEERPA